jgi:hypothetical protein
MARCSKLRLDLFDRRWQIYAATSKFVDAINNDPENVDSYLNDFNAGTSNAEFLFDSDVVTYIQLVRTHAVGMRTAHVLSDEKQRHEEKRERNIERFLSERNWLIEQVQTGAMTKTFAPYLGFANIKA